MYQNERGSIIDAQEEYKDSLERDNKLLIIINGERLIFDWTLYIKEREYTKNKERELIPKFLWKTFNLI